MENQRSQIIDLTQYEDVGLQKVTIPGLFQDQLCIVSQMEPSGQWQTIIPLLPKPKAGQEEGKPHIFPDSIMGRKDGTFFIVRLYHFHRVVRGAGQNGQDKIMDWYSPILDQSADPATNLTGAIIGKVYVDEAGQTYAGVVKEADRLPRIDHQDGLELEVPRASVSRAPDFVKANGHRGHSDQARQKDLTTLAIIRVDEMSPDLEWIPISQMTDSMDMGGLAALFAGMDKKALAKYAKRLYPKAKPKRRSHKKP